MTDYDRAFDLIIKAEGGYVSPEEAIRKGDLGGETNFGVSKRQYPDLDIKNLTIEQVKVIYKRDYWDKVKGDLMKWPLNLFVFDSAVNQGVDAAIKMLQKTFEIAQDGILGNNSMMKISSAKQFHCAKFMAIRTMRYTGTRSFDVNGMGWFIRLFNITMEAK